MNQGSSFSDPRWRVLFLVGVAALVGAFVLLSVVRMSSAARVDNGPTPAQDVIRLETRLNQLEQRLYTIETSIRTLEQQSRLAGATSRSSTVSADDFARLIAELQALQVRVREDECALAKLDERTLTAAQRDARQKSGAVTDPCRNNYSAPLRLPERRE